MRSVLAAFVLAVIAIPLCGFLLIAPQTTVVASGALCSVSGVTCDYAWSVTHQMVSSATKAFQLNNGTTTHDVGFGPAHIQGGIHQNGGSSSTAVAVTLPSTVQAGNMVACLIGMPSSASSTPLTGVTDDKSNAYTVIDSAKDTVDNYWWNTAYRLNITNAPQTITATLSSSLSFATIICDGYSGVIASAALDGHAISYQPLPTTATDAVTSGTATSVANGDLVYGGTVNVSGSGTITAGTSETQRQAVTSAFMSEDKIQATAGAVASTFTSSASTPYITATMNFKSAQLVNAADAKSFCSTTQDCYVSTIYDQTGNGCNLTNATQTLQPAFWTWGPHNALPVIQLVDSTQNPAQTLEATGCSTDSGAAARTMVATVNDSYATTSNGMVGKMANTAGVVAGASYAALVFNSGFQAIGTALEGSNVECAETLTGIDHILITTYDGTSSSTLNDNGTDCATSSVGTLATQNRVVWGRIASGAQYGPTIAYDLAWVHGALTSGQRVAAYNNLNAVYSGLPAGPIAPADLFDLGVSVNPAQITRMAIGFGVRQVNAEYYGPLLNVCQGVTGTCEDIGQQPNGLLDVTTANSFCGPSNCTIQIAYNQALAASFNTFDGSNRNLVAPSAALRPQLNFSCAGLGTGVPCMTSTGTQRLCDPGTNDPLPGITPITLSAVDFASVTSNSAFAHVFGGPVSTSDSLYYGGASPVADPLACDATPTCAIGANTLTTWVSHTGTFDGTNVTLYVNGTATAVAGTVSPTHGPVCMFDFAGSNNFIGSIVEAYGFQGVAATSGQVATLRANQRAALGF